MGILKGLFSSKGGQAALAGILIVLLSYGAKLYYDQQTRDPVRFRAQTTDELLLGVPGKLEAFASAQPEGAPRLPQSTPWAPSSLLCGEEGQAGAEAKHPTWAVLGLSWEKPSRFQYRFRALEGDRFELLARADEDCDGVYQVHRLRGGLSWSGVKADPLTVDNPNE